METAQQFLNRLKWKTATNDFKEMTSFRIDCYLFAFERPLSKEEQYAFIEYAESLDLCQERSIIILYIWLYQKEIPFRLKFQWNENLPLLYNLKQVRKPGWYQRNLSRLKEEVKVFDLEKYAERGIV